MGTITLRRNAAHNEILIEKDKQLQRIVLDEDSDSKKLAASIFKWGLKGFPRNDKNSPEL